MPIAWAMVNAPDDCFCPPFKAFSMHTMFLQRSVPLAAGWMICSVAICSIAKAAEPAASASQISLVRTPDEGIQPQAVVDAEGTLHLIYFKGDPAAGDIFYVRRERDDRAFSAPIQVNSHRGSAIAMGTIRGAQLAVGAAGRVHVVWNGSKQAQPRSSDPKHDTPMLYTRMNDAGNGFEPQRNLIQHAHGLDGGGSVAADRHGNVYVLWHANPAADGEANRRIYLATSDDDGQSFSRERAISPPGTGVCGCCGMKAMADSRGRLLVLYRSATDLVGRNMYLLTSDDGGRAFDSAMIDPWEVARCPMSSAALAEGPGGVVAGWETADQIYFGHEDGAGAISEIRTPASAEAAHPAIAVSDSGAMVLVWTEGTGWNRGGSVAWQVYDAQGNATAIRGTRQGVPTWSLATVVTDADGRFTIIY